MALAVSGKTGSVKNKETDEGRGVLIGSGIGRLICNGFVRNSQHALTLTAEILIYRAARFRVAIGFKSSASGENTFWSSLCN
jgi:hypothetical protein